MYYFTTYKYSGDVETFNREHFDFNYKEFFENHPEVRDFMVQYMDAENHLQEDVFYR